MFQDEMYVLHTKKWINDVVIACNFCPFASKVMHERKVHFRIEASETLSICLEAFQQECERLDKSDFIDTTLIIMPNAFPLFENYLIYLNLVEKLVRKHNYEGVYQVASFHPQYCFAGERVDDPANYTNRSPYPMLHILREDSVSKAIKQYPNAHEIPIRNMHFARAKGEEYMKNLWQACFAVPA